MSFQVTTSAPLPFMMTSDFFAKNIVYDTENNELGTMLENAMNKWNKGRFPTELGEHRDLPIFDAPEVTTDNGYGMNVPVNLSVSLQVERQLYFGQFPILKISGFKDEVSDGIITNAFTIGILDPDEIQRDWQAIKTEEEAPIEPVIILIGLVGWVT